MYTPVHMCVCVKSLCRQQDYKMDQNENKNLFQISTTGFLSYEAKLIE